MKSIYRKLAVLTLRKHRENYLPFLLTTIGITAMQLIISSLYRSPDLASLPGMRNMQSILEMAVALNGFFAAIFIFYTNNFLMKRRKGEFALYNMLGMEKRHLIRILAWESLFTGAAGIFGGLFFGSLLYKLTESLFFRIIRLELKGSYLPPIESILRTALLFLLIFLLNFLSNLIQIWMTRPAEMMRQSKAGEKPPKVNFLYAILGISCLGLGYGLALRSGSPLRAFVLFFIAVLFVILGTYFSFQAVSILILRLLQKNKRYYYRTAHFTSVSGLVFRMRQNAVGLANICLLSTVVLVMLSSAVALHFGAEDILRHRYPRNILISSEEANPSEVRKVQEAVDKTSADLQLSPQNILRFRHLDLVSKPEQDQGILRLPISDSPNKILMEKGYMSFLFLPLEDVQDSFAGGISLKEGQAYIFLPKAHLSAEKLQVGEKIYEVAGIESGSRSAEFLMEDIVDNAYVVLPDIKDVEAISKDLFGEERIAYLNAFDLEADRKAQLAYYENLSLLLKETASASAEGAESARFDFHIFYGGIFFCGIFLGLVFLVAVVLIIYYKQLIEGYEDRRRYEIMRKVGMNETEVKRSIRAQVLTVFFLPLIMAGIHLAFAFPILSNLLTLFNMNNLPLFLKTTGGVYLVFTMVYLLVYSLTSKTYYRIVSR